MLNANRISVWSRPRSSQIRIVTLVSTESGIDQCLWHLSHLSQSPFRQNSPTTSKLDFIKNVCRLCTPRLSNTASPAMFTFHLINPARELTGGKALLLTLTWQNPLSQIAPIISCVCSEVVCRMYYSACEIMGHNFVRFSCLIKVHSH